MHSVTLAEIAAILSQHCPDLVASQTEIRAEAVTCYWASSRNRFNHWHGVLSAHRAAQRMGQATAMRSWWEHNLSVLEEIVVSEMLSRVVAAAAGLIEAANGRDEVSSVTHNVYLTHLEASNRVHQLIIRGEGHAVHHAVRLNRLRQGVQRWTDALLGRMSFEPGENLAFAFDYDRAKTHCEESRICGSSPQRKMTCWLMQASMRETLSRRTSGDTAFPQANQDVANAVISLLQPELFDDLGTLKSGWTQRLQRGVSPTECSPALSKQSKPDWRNQADWIVPSDEV